MERTHSVCSDLPAYKTRGHAPLSLPQTDIGDSASDRIAHTAAIISQPYTHNATNIAGLRRLGFPLSTVERGSGGEVVREHARTHAVCPYSHAAEYKTSNTAAIISQPYTHSAIDIVCCGRDKSRPYIGTDAAVGLWQCRSRTREARGHAPLSPLPTDTHNATNIASIRRLGFPLSTVERGSGGEVKRVNGVRSNYSDFYSLNI